MKITVDDRERASGVIEHLRKTGGFEIEFARLETGDYAADGAALFERKTMRDFAASIIDGRLFEQAARLARSVHPAVMIIEGTARDYTSTRMRREALQGALISLAVVYGIPILRSNGPEETARLISYTASHTGRPQPSAGPSGNRVENIDQGAET